MIPRIPLTSHLHVSSPLTMVVVGLMIAKHGRPLAMSDTTRRYVDLFWALLDEILNAVLFVLIGMEVLVISFSASIFLAAGCDHRDTSGPPADGGRSRRAC